MSEPIPIIMENSIQIAWDYLERTGDLGDPKAATKCCWSRWKQWLGGVSAVS